ncbi:MAG: hypothetical protein PHE18_00720 [Candidatus Omnitrophica bacterium]|nr:hypothetical protein [Candidatus Omnitrophota bacterium]MDD5552384.1 hypothetical protein [Candidatus Omnitrophota bacterium]
MPMFVALCALVILLGFEIRYREMAEDMVKLRTRINILTEEIAQLKEAMKLKKNAFEEYNKPITE